MNFKRKLKFSTLLPFYLVISLVNCATSADVVAVVSASCTINTLSKNEVRNIFLGLEDQTTDSLKIIPIDQAENSPVRHEFYLMLDNKSPTQVKAHWSQVVFTGRGLPPDQVANSEEMKLYLLTHPDTIGYLEKEMVDDSLKIVFPQ